MKLHPYGGVELCLLLNCCDQTVLYTSHIHIHTPLTAIFQVNSGVSRSSLISLQWSLSWASSWDRPKAKLSLSPLTQYHKVFIGHPLFPGPSVSSFIHRFKQSVSFLRSLCSDLLNLLLSIPAYFSCSLQIITTHPSKHTHLIPILLCFMHHFNWQSLTIMNQTAGMTSIFENVLLQQIRMGLGQIKQNQRCCCCSCCCWCCFCYYAIST